MVSTRSHGHLDDASCRQISSRQNQCQVAKLCEAWTLPVKLSASVPDRQPERHSRKQLSLLGALW